MSRQEYHKGKIKKVDLSQFNNDKEKYFEARYRYEFAADENRPNGLTEEEIQKAYERECEYNKYSDLGRGPWQRLWFDNTEYYDQIITVNDELWEIADVELDEEETIMHKISDTEYTYYTSFYNGGCCLWEALEYGLKRQKRNENNNR